MGKTIRCKCETEVSTDFKESYSLAEDPELQQKILDGSFMSVHCPACGSVLKPEMQVHVEDPDHGMDLLMLPETSRSRFLAGALDVPPHNRVVIGYPELVEKIRLVRDGLDDRAVEIVKFYLLQRAGNEVDPRIYYQCETKDALTFHLHGLREGEIAVAKVPRNVYDRVTADLHERSTEDPFKTVIEPPYVSIEKITIEGDDEDDPHQ